HGPRAQDPASPAGPDIPIAWVPSQSPSRLVFNRRSPDMRASRLSIWTAAAVATAVSLGAAKVGVAQDKPSVIVTYWQQATALPETILATQPSLQATIPATITYRPRTSGPAALAAMKAGAYDFVGGVGNPPVLSAIANQTNMKIIWAQYYDLAGFAVQKDIQVPNGLIGKDLAQ